MIYRKLKNFSVVFPLKLGSSFQKFSKTESLDKSKIVKPNQFSSITSFLFEHEWELQYFFYDFNAVKFVFPSHHHFFLSKNHFNTFWIFPWFLHSFHCWKICDFFRNHRLFLLFLTSSPHFLNPGFGSKPISVYMSFFYYGTTSQEKFEHFILN